MDQGIQGGKRKPGGIISLARFALEHRKAIEADLLCTGYEFDDIGRNLSWGALDSFLSHPKEDSALVRELEPETAAWASRAKTNRILADIWDQLALINANLVAIGQGRPAKTPKPYPVPGRKSNDSEKRIGSGAMPPIELRRWIEERRERYARDSAGDDCSHSGTVRSSAEDNV